MATANRARTQTTANGTSATTEAVRPKSTKTGSAKAGKIVRLKVPNRGATHDAEVRPRDSSSPKVPLGTRAERKARQQALLSEVMEPTDLPLWRELYTPADWMRLRASKVYYGIGTPKGDGAPVILVPGFMATDSYLLEMYCWLWRIGYKPYMSGIGRNSDCPNKLVQNLLRTVQRAHKKTGRKVHLVGHSLGGVLSRVAASYRPDLIASVTMLGSPVRGVRVHPWILGLKQVIHRKIHLAKRAQLKHFHPHDDCYTDACACGFACQWKGQFPDEQVQQTAIYTKTDGVVDWKMCRFGDRKTDRLVEGTHVGLAWNADVYRIIARQLKRFSKGV